MYRSYTQNQLVKHAQRDIPFDATIVNLSKVPQRITLSNTNSFTMRSPSPPPPPIPSHLLPLQLLPPLIANLRRRISESPACRFMHLTALSSHVLFFVPPSSMNFHLNLIEKSVERCKGKKGTDGVGGGERIKKLDKFKSFSNRQRWEANERESERER